MKRIDYWDYIRVEELLALQGGIDNDESLVTNDEALFIVVHQIYELWFKLVLKELVAARDLFKQNPVPDDRMAAAVRALRRVTAILRQSVSHFEVMETLTTRDFLAFRDRLIPASGFQSAQLREIEIILGLPDEERISLGREGSYVTALRKHDGSGSPASRRVEARIADPPSLRDVVEEWLSRTPIDGSLPGSPDDDARVLDFVEGFLAGHKSEAQGRIERAAIQALTPEDIKRLEDRYAAEMQQARAFLMGTEDPSATPEQVVRRRRIRAALVFVESYRELPLLAWPREVIDAIVEVEEQFVIFRQRHARMVERVIGRRTGSGGSAGVEYLDRTAQSYRVFRNLWAVRTLLLREQALPPLKHAESYGFKFL